MVISVTTQFVTNLRAPCCESVLRLLVLSRILGRGWCLVPTNSHRNKVAKWKCRTIWGRDVDWAWFGGLLGLCSWGSARARMCDHIRQVDVDSVKRFVEENHLQVRVLLEHAWWRVVCDDATEVAASAAGVCRDASFSHSAVRTRRLYQMGLSPVNRVQRFSVTCGSACMYVCGRVSWGQSLPVVLLDDHVLMLPAPVLGHQLRSYKPATCHEGMVICRCGFVVVDVSLPSTAAFHCAHALAVSIRVCVQHFSDHPAHTVVVNLSTRMLWCYACDDEVMEDATEPESSVVRIMLCAPTIPALTRSSCCWCVGWTPLARLPATSKQYDNAWSGKPRMTNPIVTPRAATAERVMQRGQACRTRRKPRSDWWGYQTSATRALCAASPCCARLTRHACHRDIQVLHERSLASACQRATTVSFL